MRPGQLHAKNRPNRPSLTRSELEIRAELLEAEYQMHKQAKSPPELLALYGRLATEARLALSESTEGKQSYLF